MDNTMSLLAQQEATRDRAWGEAGARADLRLRWQAIAVRHTLHVVPGDEILEFGAGAGRWTRELASALPGAAITGATFSNKVESRSPLDWPANVQRVGLQHVAGDLNPESYHYVVASSMNLQGGSEDALRMVHRLLKPGGEALFFEPQESVIRHYFGPQARSRSDVSSSDELTRRMKGIGFEDVDVQPYDVVPEGVSPGLAQRVQAKVILLEHAPVIRNFCGWRSVWARKSGRSQKVWPDLAVVKSLFGAVSVVVPCYNEAPNIPTLVNRLIAMYGNYIHEIIIVNDNSTDDTAAVTERIAATESRVRLLNRSKPNGVGRALKDGYRVASGKYILSMDSDFVHILPEFRELFEAVGAGKDGAIGSRFSRNSILIRYPFAKMVFNRALHLLVKIFLTDVRDVSNNLKLYRADIAKGIDIQSPHFSANLEIGLVPLLQGYNISEVPISWINRTAEMGSSSFKLLKVGPGYARTLFRLWRNRRTLADRRLSQSVSQL
jgi:SAM-dependent methyltransferase